MPKGQSLPEDIGLEIIPISKVIDAIVAAIPSERSGDFPVVPEED